MAELTRRALIAAGGAGGIAAVLATSGGSAAGQHVHGEAVHAGHEGSGHADFRGGRTVDHAANGFDPHAIARDFDWGRTSRTASGRVLREWELVALDREIEVAPGVRFAAWTYNGRIPGPTLRCREGERLRITFANASEHPHTIHFHGIHPPTWTACRARAPARSSRAARRSTSSTRCPPACTCTTATSARWPSTSPRGSTARSSSTRSDGREDAEELVMVMNGFDTNFDRANELYAANTIPFAYMDQPLEVPHGELIRLYIVNVLEYDLINSFHLHGNLFDWYPTGTSRTASELTDTVMLCQGQRGIARVALPDPRPVHVPRAPVRVHRARLAGLLRGAVMAALGSRVAARPSGCSGSSRSR